MGSSMEAFKSRILMSLSKIKKSCTVDIHYGYRYYGKNWYFGIHFYHLGFVIHFYKFYIGVWFC